MWAEGFFSITISTPCTKPFLFLVFINISLLLLPYLTIPFLPSHPQVVEVAGGAARGVRVTGLQPGTQYLYTVQARNTQGPSSYVTPHVTATTHGKPSHICRGNECYHAR